MRLIVDKFLKIRIIIFVLSLSIILYSVIDLLFPVGDNSSSSKSSVFHLLPPDDKKVNGLHKDLVIRRYELDVPCMYDKIYFNITSNECY